MKISVILAHPDRGSFNHAIAETAVEQLKKNGHGVFYHDLYGEGFDPLLTGKRSLKTPLCPGSSEGIVRKSKKPRASSLFTRTGGVNPRPY
jgi:putative NADPH-quinone reductase